jgi:hypothetical protein
LSQAGHLSKTIVVDIAWRTKLRHLPVQTVAYSVHSLPAEIGDEQCAALAHVDVLERTLISRRRKL